ncbi:MAG: hypothetical protein KJ621_02120 [Proteobacteria bacterium]|nr:hypothetical protein [Pseudomonadota bacterium]MBU1741275.1 hypothetical protein [Pseudomonadota bacterium]
MPDGPATFTIPGRWGDIIYALTVIRAYAAQTKQLQHLVISPQAKVLRPLLRIQPYLASVTVAQKYAPQTGDLGLQPYQVPVPDEHPRPVYHLGLRPELNADTVFKQPLPQTFGQNLVAEGGPHLDPDLTRPWLFLDHPLAQVVGPVIAHHGRGQRPVDLPDKYVVCQPWGTSTHQFYLAPADAQGQPDTGLLFDHLLGGDYDALRRTFTRKDIWTKILTGLKCPLIVVGSRDDLDTVRRLIPLDPKPQFLEPVSGLELAKLIYRAQAFIGAESVGAALAAGLKKPGILDTVFNNTVPVDQNSLTVLHLSVARPPRTTRGPQDVYDAALDYALMMLQRLGIR